MTETKDPWEAVQKKISQLADALDEFKTVRVQTVITDLEWIRAPSEDKNGSPVTKVTGIQPAHGEDGSPKGLVTSIDMLDGDIRLYRSPDLSEAEMSSLEKAHADHVELARKTFNDNIRAIAELVERFAVRSTPQQQREPAE